jgi:uncharacterized protein
MKPIRKAEDLFQLLKEEQLLEQFGLKRVGLFGSLARGEQFNDIDLLVEEEADYRDLLEFKKILEIKTGYKVDIVQRQFAEPVILYRALKDVRYAIAS